jgi:hypothetical protein
MSLYNYANHILHLKSAVERLQLKLAQTRNGDLDIADQVGCTSHTSHLGPAGDRGSAEPTS